MCSPPPGSSSNPMELKYPRLLTALLIQSAGRQRNKLERQIKAVKKKTKTSKQVINLGETHQDGTSPTAPVLVFSALQPCADN